MIVAASSITLSPAAFLRSSGIRFLSPKRLISLRKPSLIDFHPSVLLPKRSSKLQVRAARTESSSVSLGSRAPYFELPEPLTGKKWKLDDFESYPALLVMFICNHCPFVKHLKKDFVKITNFYTKKGLAVVAISSNSALTHPQDGPTSMAEEAKLFNYTFPYLFDESQDVARAFGAVCTPEFFLYRKPRHGCKYIKWLRPELDWIKLNSDGASKGNPGYAGGGGVIRNNKVGKIGAGICAAVAESSLQGCFRVPVSFYFCCS